MVKDKKTITLSICKNCTGQYDKAEVKHTLGEFSMPYILGYCSARCYTLHQIHNI